MPGAFDTPGTPVSITGLGQYIIVADTDAVRAYSYNGTTFIMTGEYITTGNAVHVWTDGKYIYVSASGDGLLALTFDGSDFTLVAQMPADSDPDASTIMSTGDGNYIYVNDTDRLKVLSFNGKYFVHVFEREPYYSSSRLDALYVDGVNIFLGWSAPYKLEAIRISGDKLVNVATNNKADGVADIRSDGTYLYVTYAASPMEIYSGFTCNSGNNNPKGMPVSLNYQKGKIGTGVQRVCAIYPDGSLWCWGYGAEGGNGNGSTASQTTPVRVNSTRSFVQVDLG